MEAYGDFHLKNSPAKKSFNKKTILALVENLMNLEYREPFHRGFKQDILYGDVDALKMLLNGSWRLAEADGLMILNAVAPSTVQNIFARVATGVYPVPEQKANSSPS